MELRPWQPGDETRIVELFKLVFGTEMTPEFWNWRFRDHPAGGPLIVLAWDGDRLAAHYAACHAPLMADGRRLGAALSMTTMTHPDYRGQGLFEKTASALYDGLAAQGGRAIWGFPNRNSNVPFRRKLGWDGMADVATLACDLGTGETALPAEITEVDRIDARFSALNEGQDGILPDHSAEILSWRVDRNPVNRYLRLALPDGDGLAGYAILKPYGQDDMDLVDLRARDPAAGAVLIRAAQARARAAGAKRMNTWSLPADPSRVSLERSGFAPSGTVTYFGGSPLGEGVPGFGDPRRWRISMLDSDLY